MSYPFAGRYFNKYKPFFPYELGDYSFKVDLQYGELLFTKKLISFSGKHLPLDLSLKFVQRHVDNGTMFSSYSGFPKGFKTNYHVFLEYDSTNSRYLYEDSDGFQHIFELAVNSQDLYYDTFGSGLMLESTNSGFVIFDEDENYQEFDQYGRLIKIHKNIHKHNSTTYYAEQNISYSSDLRISSNTDNYNRTITFSYSGSYITISYSNNVVITLYTSNACLTKISKNIGGNHIKEDTIWQTNLVSGVTLPNGLAISFSYSGSVLGYLHVNSGQEHYSFDYDDNKKQAEVTNARNVSTIYNYSQEQTVSQTSESNVNLAYLKINSNIATCTIKDNSNNPEITEFLFNSIPSININGNTTGYSDYIINNDLQPKRMYLFYAEISTNNPVDLEIQLYDYSGNYLADLLFKGYTRTLSFPVGIKPADNNEFRIKYINNSSNSVTITSAKLVPLIGDFEALCSNCNTGGPVFFYGNTPYYLFKQGQVAFINGNYYDNVTNHDPRYQDPFITFDDYLKNERLFYKRNGTFHFWCKDQKILIDNASRVFNAVGGGGFVAYDASINIVAHYTGLYTMNDIIWFYRIKGNQNNTFSVTKVSHFSEAFHTGYTSYYYEEEDTKYVAGNTGYVTYYDYDENYALIESNRDDGYKEEYSYDSHGNLVDKTISQSYSTKKIKTTYEYDSNDNLISHSKLMDTSFETINYNYDNFGNVEEIDYPNGLEQGFDYDNITGERNLDVDFGENSAVEMVHNNTYVDGSHYILNQENNSYYFAYSNGQLSSVSYNNQNIVSFTYQSATYQGVLIYTEKTTSYNNNYSFVEEYDAYDRISYIEGIRYYYDDFGRVTSYSDNNLGTPYAITSFTYDYYHQKANISIMHTGLSNEFTYDSYRRLINQVYKRDNNNLYNASYIYYTIPNLENVIKQTNLSIGSTSISVINGMDSFSRLTSKSIAIGNNDPYTQHISYYVGGPNNGYTSNMVESVYTERIVFSPRHTFTITEGDYYTYDSVGNIITIANKLNNSILSQTDYIYDAYSRLKRENNQVLNKTIVYEYDDDGNITSKIEYAYVTSQTLPTNPLETFNYDYYSSYPTRLKSYGTQAADNLYDNIGNPIRYRDKNMSWIRGTLLSQVDDGTTLINLEYDGLKQRIRKSTNSGSSVTNYRYINNQLILEEKDNTTITYLYAHNGVIGFKLSGFDSSLNLNGVYYYEKNIQQDVIAIRDINNNIKAKYIYDAWGNHNVCNPNGTVNNIDTFIGNINPIRYRSYYYDIDLKMYWLTTRYYDPEVGRFISPDHYSFLDYKRLHGLNLYAYSKNNPVMYCDPSGHWIVSILLASIALAAIGTIIGMTTVDLINICELEATVEEDGNVKIANSTKIITPWVQYGYAFYLKYINKDTKDKIEGSALGVQFEWLCHNVAYYGCSLLDSALSIFGLENDDIKGAIESAKEVQVGETLFSDSGHKIPGVLMKVAYILFLSFMGESILLCSDLKKRGWGNDFK